MRRATATAFLSALIAIFAAVPGAAAPRAQGVAVRDSTDSVTYQSTISHDGHVVDPAISLPLTKRWSVPLNGPSYPIIAEGLVIVTSATPPSSYGSRLTAFDAGTGDVAWHRNISGTYNWSAAAYDAGRVFVVNFDGLLRAFDAADGSMRW
ncbi:MAG: PQQ-binding-like beta-propeller repeat protein, partial [Actinomycetota bacterium]